MKFDISMRLALTLSKTVGTIVAITGCYGFVSGKDAAQSVLLVGLGLAAIGVKQYFTSKNETKS